MSATQPEPEHRNAASRYARQIRVQGFGSDAQERLAAARVAIVGLGALGSRVAEDLARAGVGYLRLIDRDWVELSNLHRQHLYDESHAANEDPKALACAERIARINSTVELDPQVRDLEPSEADEALREIDLLIDGTDNFQTRYLINDYAVRERKPWIYGACVSSQAMVAPFLPGGACLRCVFPEPPPASATPTCETAGILPPAAAIVTAHQCALALRILGVPDAEIATSLVTADVLSGDLRTIRLPSEPDARCVACATREFPGLELAAASRTKKLCGRNAVQLTAPRSGFPSLETLAQKLGDNHAIEMMGYMLRLQTPEAKITVFPGGRAIVQGTEDEGRARALFDRYVGS